MNAQFGVIRAVGSEFLRRKFKGLVILYVGIVVVVVALLIWLSSATEWWWILAIIAIPFLLVCGVALLIARWVVRTLRPSLSKEQKTAVGSFVDKLERVAESVQTPLFIILFKVVLDVIRPSQQTFIESVTKDGSTLHTDFIELRKLFL